ncbi:MAG: heavy-metal-associated domain-containing protein [Ignavibacteriales bacterium]|nr:heavy-metal-associated domain-containing protein [Ignavibacteriales bacterium]
MYSKIFTSIITFSLLASFVVAGSTTEVKFKSLGNCGMCQKRIEKSLKINEVSSASWDKKSKMLTVKYNASAITLDSLQQRVAAVGHDTEKFKASDDVYENLPGCCLYRD